MKHDAPAIIAMTNQRFKEFLMTEVKKVEVALEDPPHGPDNPVVRDPPFQPSIDQIEELIETHGSSNVHLDTDGTVSVGPLRGYDIVRPTEGSVLMCARLVHVAVEALNSAHNEYTVPWEANKASIIAGVRRTLANPHESPQANHEAWCKFKKSEGWVYGPTKDAVAKTHPCMVPYAALGPFQQSKDAIFQALVRTFFGLDQAVADEPKTTLEFLGAGEDTDAE